MLLIHLLHHQPGWRVAGRIKKKKKNKKISLDLQLISIGLIYFYNSQPGTLIRDGYNQKTGKKKRRQKEIFPSPYLFSELFPVTRTVEWPTAIILRTITRNVWQTPPARPLQRHAGDKKAVYRRKCYFLLGKHDFTGPAGLDEHAIGA